MRISSQNPVSTDAAPRKNRRAGKAVLAGAVAVGLLTAGGGTFSKWYEEQQITPDTLSSGELSMSAKTAPVWTDQNGTIDPATYRMVPGDTVTFTTNTTITAVGDNLTGSLEVDPTGIVIDDPALLQGLDIDANITGLTDTNGADGWTVVGQEGATANDNGRTAGVTITIAWPTTKPDGSNWGTDDPATGTGAGEATSVDLGAMKLKLTQNA